GLEAEGGLEAFEVALEMDGWGGLGDGAEDLADDEPVVDEAQREAVSVGEDGFGRLVELFEAGEGAAAEGGEGFGEADGLDDVSGGGVEVLPAEETGDAGHPSLDDQIGAGPEVVVPAG